MKKEYQTFVRQFKDLKEGKRELFIKDLSPGPRKYDTKHVLAKISKDPKKLADADILRIRSEAGTLDNQVWGIKILKELPESVPGHPWDDIFEAMKK